MSLPTITIIDARLTADAELRFTTAGIAVTSFTVACNDRKFDKDRNEWTDGDATFLNCSVWREQAENAAELRKGDQVHVTGRLKQRSWEKDGVKRTVHEVDVESVSRSMRWKGKGASSGGGGPRQQARQYPAGDPWGAPQQPRGQQDDPWAQSSTQEPPF